MKDGSGQRIVVGVDGSEGSHSALHWAVDESRLRDATLVVLLADDQPDWPNYLPNSGSLAADVEAAARRTLEAMADVAGGAGLTVEAEYVQADAASALITASLDADLLVVGSRGRGRFTGALLGSVSLHCVQHARCPVVVVRPHDPDAVAP